MTQAGKDLPADGDARPWLVFVSTRAPYPPVTGHFIRTLNIIRQISLHYRVALFAFFDKGLSSEEQSDVRAALSKDCAFVHLRSLRAESSKLAMLALLARSLAGSKPLVAYKYYDREMASAIRDFLSKNEVELIHLDMLPLVEYLDVVRDHPVVLTQHNIESDRLRRIASTRKGFLARWFFHQQARKLSRYEEAALNSVEHCCVVSENDGTRVRSLNERCNTYVVPNGVDIAKFTPGPVELERPDNILWVGGMNDEYNREGVEYFAKQVWPKIRAMRPAVTWTVIGKSPPRDLVELSKSGGVELPGFVDDLLPYYRQSAVVVVPLLSGAGTKLKVIEAMAMGKATVVTPVGAEGIADEHSSFLSVANSSREFANRVVELLDDGERRRSLGALARAEAETRFDWQGIGGRQIAAYDAVIGSGRCAE